MLLQDANAFGQGETLSVAVGTLSLTDSERESGYSISSLFVKYRTQLVGYYWAEVFGKEFPCSSALTRWTMPPLSVPSW